jgi:hypothetical protein
MNNARGYGSEIMGFTQGHMEAAAQGYSNGVNKANPIGQSEMDREMGRTEIAGKELFSVIGELESALASVLAPEEPPKDACGAGAGAAGAAVARPSPQSPLAKSISGLGDNAQRAHARLRAILRRLAL